MNDNLDSQPTPVPDGDVLPDGAPALELLDDALLSRCAVTVMYPGDRVLLLCPVDPTEAPAVALLDYLRAGFPGVDFHLVGGVAGALVMPGEWIGGLSTPDGDTRVTTAAGVQLHPEAAPAPRPSVLTDGVPR